MQLDTRPRDRHDYQTETSYQLRTPTHQTTYLLPKSSQPFQDLNNNKNRWGWNKSTCCTAWWLCAVAYPMTSGTKCAEQPAMRCDMYVKLHARTCRGKSLGSGITQFWVEQKTNIIANNSWNNDNISSHSWSQTNRLNFSYNSNKTRAVQDYDLYLIHYDYFELLWLHYDSQHILSSLITVEYNTIWLWIQYDVVVIFNHNNNILKCHRNAQFWCCSGLYVPYLVM